MKCPHCSGDLVKAPLYVNWDYKCLLCGRVWYVRDDLWHAGFDAGAHIYRVVSGKVVEDINRNHPKWAELWEKFRKESPRR